MAKKQRESSPVAKFKVADKVHIKRGVTEVDDLDIPLASWVGNITAVHKDNAHGHPERIKVIGLGEPDEGPMIDETYGTLEDYG